MFPNLGNTTPYIVKSEIGKKSLEIVEFVPEAESMENNLCWL